MYPGNESVRQLDIPPVGDVAPTIIIESDSDHGPVDLQSYRVRIPGGDRRYIPPAGDVALAEIITSNSDCGPVGLQAHSVV